VNLWLAAAVILLLGGLGPCTFVCLRAAPTDRLVALELAGLIATLELVCLAEAFGRDVYFDLALALGLLSFAGGIVFAHFLERWV
jgi:multicomponent Na+:H+ antiporter subunit F